MPEPGAERIWVSRITRVVTSENVKKKCANCDKPAEADRYKYCFDCWWKQDPRNTPEWDKRKRNDSHRSPRASSQEDK